MPMDLRSKSKENLQVVEYAIKRQKYFNALAGRAYYAVYQSLKHYLVSKKFDYGGFLRRIGKEDQREFSHGTIMRACVEQLCTTGVKQDELRCLNFIGDMYYIRWRADYTDSSITPAEFSWCVESAKKIVKIMYARENKNNK